MSIFKQRSQKEIGYVGLFLIVQRKSKNEDKTKIVSYIISLIKKETNLTGWSLLIYSFFLTMVWQGQVVEGEELNDHAYI